VERKHKRRLGGLRLAAVAIAVALPVAAACAPVKSGAPPDIYSRANEIRAQNGAGPLNPCPSLAAAAQAHANDMAARGRLDHSGFPDRVRNAYGGGYWGEIIAYGQPTADAVLAAWLSSSQHSGILLDPSFRDVGFGFANGYWVGDFGNGGQC
jgi:uncharacterized protein YkwD